MYGGSAPGSRWPSATTAPEGPASGIWAMEEAGLMTWKQQKKNNYSLA